MSFLRNISNWIKAQTYNYKLLVRRDSDKKWIRSNVILSKNELAYDTANNKLKIGDGVNYWRDLPYCSEWNNQFSPFVKVWVGDYRYDLLIKSESFEKWQEMNPILRKGCISFDLTNNWFKVGDSKTEWKDLSYVNKE